MPDQVKLQILVDVDGVLADFVGAVCEVLEREDIHRVPDDFRHWNLSRTLTEREQALLQAAAADPWFQTDNINWYQGAVDFVYRLQRLGNLCALTAPFPGAASWCDQRLDWLSKAISHDSVIFAPTARKHLVRGDVLIEDHPGACREWLQSNRDGIAILIDRPWNSINADEFKQHPRMHRARTYADALSLIAVYEATR